MVVIENLKKEIEDLKLKNEMLIEEVKLLNYSLNERDKEIEKLKKKNIGSKNAFERTSSRKSSLCEQVSLIEKQVDDYQPKKVESIKEIEKE